MSKCQSSEKCSQCVFRNCLRTSHQDFSKVVMSRLVAAFSHAPSTAMIADAKTLWVESAQACVRADQSEPTGLFRSGGP